MNYYEEIFKRIIINKTSSLYQLADTMNLWEASLTGHDEICTLGIFGNIYAYLGHGHISEFSKMSSGDI